MKRSVATTSVGSDKETPDVRLLLHNVDGVVPYMTPFLLKKHFPAPQPHLLLGIAARDSCTGLFFAEKSTKKSKRGKSSSSKTIVGYKFSPQACKPDVFLNARYKKIFVPSFDPIQDALDVKQGKSMASSSDGILAWTPHGRLPLNCKAFQELTNTVQADMVVPLFDAALDSDSKKRRSNAAQRTNKWFDGFDARNQPQQVLQPVSICGRPDVMRPPSSNAPKFSGIAIVGYQHVESRTERRKRLTDCLRFHGDKRSSVVLHAGTTEQVVDAIAAGVHDIGCRLPTEWADANRAFVISTRDWKGRKRAKSSTNSLTGVEEETMVDGNGCINLADKRFVTDKRPILEGCQCLACSKHIRSYVHHLVNVNELLSKILLFSHNLHQMVCLCEAATVARSTNDLDAFCNFLYNELQSDPCTTES